MNVLGPVWMKPGVVPPTVVYWPTIMPLSLIPKAAAERPAQRDEIVLRAADSE